MRKGHNNSVSTLVDSVIGKPAPFESYRTFRNPLWIIRLLMESELRYISCISIIVGPPDIRRIRDIRIGTSHRLLVFIGSIVGYLIILQSLFFYNIRYRPTRTIHHRERHSRSYRPRPSLSRVRYYLPTGHRDEDCHWHKMRYPIF